MPIHKTLSQAYDSCIINGLIRDLDEVNHDKIRKLIENSKISISSAKIISNNLKKDSKEWMNVFTLNYESIRILAEALLLTSKITSSNHQCLFAALCIKYEKLDLDWNFFENIRTIRNGINYYGKQINYKTWKSVEIQINLYYKLVLGELENKLKSQMNLK